MDNIKKFGDTVYKFIMENYHNPFLWIILFCVMLAIGLIAIKELADK